MAKVKITIAANGAAVFSFGSDFDAMMASNSMSASPFQGSNADSVIKVESENINNNFQVAISLNKKEPTPSEEEHYYKALQARIRDGKEDFDAESKAKALSQIEAKLNQLRPAQTKATSLTANTTPLTANIDGNKLTVTSNNPQHNASQILQENFSSNKVTGNGESAVVILNPSTDKKKLEGFASKYKNIIKDFSGFLRGMTKYFSETPMTQQLNTTSTPSTAHTVLTTSASTLARSTSPSKLMSCDANGKFTLNRLSPLRLDPAALPHYVDSNAKVEHNQATVQVTPQNMGKLITFINDQKHLMEADDLLKLVDNLQNHVKRLTTDVTTGTKVDTQTAAQWNKQLEDIKDLSPFKPGTLQLK